MNRRAFMTALASVPLLGRLAPKVPGVPTLYGELSDELAHENVIFPYNYWLAGKHYTAIAVPGDGWSEPVYPTLDLHTDE